MSVDGAPKQILNFINGEFRAAASGKRDEVLNPATGDVICEVASSDAADADAATAPADPAPSPAPGRAARPGAPRGRTSLRQLVDGENTKPGHQQRAEQVQGGRARRPGEPEGDRPERHRRRGQAEELTA